MYTQNKRKLKNEKLLRLYNICHILGNYAISFVTTNNKLDMTKKELLKHLEQLGYTNYFISNEGNGAINVQFHIEEPLSYIEFCDMIERKYDMLPYWFKSTSERQKRYDLYIGGFSYD